MKMYSKKLKSLEELKREKQVLRYAKKHTASQDLFSPDQFMPKKSGKSSGSKSNFLAMAGDILTSKSTADMALSIGLPLMKMGGLKAGKGLFKIVGKELIGGYLKWKLIHFAATTVIGMVKKKKEINNNTNKKTKRG